MGDGDRLLHDEVHRQGSIVGAISSLVVGQPVKLPLPDHEGIRQRQRPAGGIRLGKVIVIAGLVPPFLDVAGPIGHHARLSSQPNRRTGRRSGRFGGGQQHRGKRKQQRRKWAFHTPI